MVSDVIEELKDKASEHTPIVPVLVPGLKIFHAGTLGTSNGGFIGLPIWFEFNTKEDISKKLVVKKKDGTVATEDDDVYNCFVLSDIAKKYAIAREILLINTPQVYVDAFVVVPIVYVIDVSAIALVGHLRIATYPLGIRCLFYTAVTLFGLILWWNIHKTINQYWQSEAESNITQLSSDYVKGGLEFYSKEIEREELSVELKDQKTRIVKFVEDLISQIVPFDGFSPTFKIAYLKANLQKDNKVVNV